MKFEIHTDFFGKKLFFHLFMCNLAFKADHRDLSTKTLWLVLGVSQYIVSLAPQKLF